MIPAKAHAQAREHERQAMRATTQKEFAALGSFVSTATRSRLLGALKQLKPDLHIRLRTLERIGDERRYQLEVETDDLQRARAIDPWLGIKGALTSAFPAHHPGAVRRLQP